VFGITALLYVVTMNRTIGFIDRGELAAVATTLGIAHPTGYPTLTLLGFLFTRLVPIRPVLALDLLAALLVAGGAAILTLLFDQTLSRLTERSLGRGRAPIPAREPIPLVQPLRPTPRAVIAAIGALFTALTATWWQQANGFEAYALHALLIPLVAWLFLKFVEGQSSGRLFAFFLGLSFTNHGTTVLLGPAFLVYYFWVSGFRRATFSRALRVIPYLMLGLIPWLWLPIRAASGPRFNWGDPDNLRRFLEHVSGRQYQAWMFSDLGTLWRQTSYFLSLIPSQFAYLGLVVLGLGVLRVVQRDRRLAALVGLLVAAPIVYAGSYQIRDIDPYYLTAIMAFGMCFVAGLSTLQQRLGTKVAVTLGAALVVANGVLHYRFCDESGNTMAEDLTHDMLGPLPERAVLVTSQWDYGLSASFYFQEVERVRPDVLVINPEMMRRTWYLDELERRDPRLIRRAAPEVARFRREVWPFEHQRPHDPAVIQVAYVDMINAMIDRSASERPVFVTFEVDPRMGGGYARVPFGLAQRLLRDTAYVAQEFPRYRLRPWRNRTDSYVATTCKIYGRSLAERMMYEAQHGRPSVARRYGEYAVRFDPDFDEKRLPPLPLDGREITLQSLSFFRELRRHVRSKWSEPDLARR